MTDTPKINTFDDYQKAASVTAIYPKNVMYPFLGLSGEAGEVAELAKKCLRDDGGVWNDNRLAALKKELGDVAWYLAAIANDHGFSLTEIVQANIDKLYSRKERGVLNGSGNDR